MPEFVHLRIAGVLGTVALLSAPAVASGPKITAHPPRVLVTKVAAPKPAAPKVHTPKVPGHAPAPKGATKAASPHPTSNARPSTRTAPPATWTPTNPIAERLAGKTAIETRVRAALPVGTDLNLATTGFKNFGQFVAAVNVSRNLGIPFADLKGAMTGKTLAGTTTGQPTVSLGRAIQEFKPGVDGDAEASHALKTANEEIGVGGR